MRARALGGVSVIVLTYQPDLEALDACLASAAAAIDTARGDELLLVDNASAEEAALRALARRHGATFVATQRNGGFAYGINRGVRTATCGLVFLLNPDAVLAPDAIEVAVRVLDAQPPECLGVAPKMLLAEHPGRLDSVGIAINGAGEAFNVGLGQPDLGQYDETERRFGVCFGAALLRRNAFDTAAVGPLDERYFLYYEDVDWSFRATLYGFHFVTAPGSVVTHVMSTTVRERPYGFKFRLIERNLVRNAIKHFEARRAASIAVRRSLGHLRGALNGHYRVDSVRATLGVLAQMPGVLSRRRRIQQRRVVADADVIAYAAGEETFFDSVRYAPIDHERATAFATRRNERAKP